MRYAQWCALVSVIFIVIFARAPEVLLLPSMQADDGINVFAYFYENRAAEHILRFKGGYIPLVANLIGYFSVRLPTRWIPYGMAWGPLMITLAAYSWLFSTRYKQWLESDLSRAVVCFLFALAPLSQFHLLAHTDYSIWNTLLLLILMSVTPLPQAPKWKYLYWMLTAALIWSHPLTILVMPFHVYFWFRDRPNRLLYSLTILNLLIHSAYGVEHAQMIHLAEVGLAGMLFRAVEWSLIIAAETAFRTAFGPTMFNWASVHMPALFVVWIIFVCGAVLAVLVKSRQSWLPLSALIYVTLGLTFLNILGRGYAETMDLNGGVRYVYIQSLAFIALFVFLIDKLACVEVGVAVPATGKQDATHKLRLSHIIVVAVLGHYLVMNGSEQAAYHYSHPDNGRIVREFFKRLEEVEKRSDIPAGSYLAAERKNDWPLHVRLAGHR